MIDNQFYPTPERLAKRAFRKFNNGPVKRLLEPSAGRGDLLDAVCRSFNIGKADCIEIDLQNQAILRDKDYRVIDSDFLQFNGRGAMYSHIIMNPPFAQGVEHTLKAWNILFRGEIVSIINANSLNNPGSKKASFLADLIREHGSVEFLSEQFSTEDTQRRTEVEIALIHLEKHVVDPFGFYIPFKDLKRDETKVDVISDNNKHLALPQSAISNLVTSFNVAVDALRRVTFAEEEAKYYSSLIFSQISVDRRPSDRSCIIKSEGFNARYLSLKESAWRAVLNTTDFSERLSSKAAKRLESEFNSVIDLEFTEANIYGLLSGLIAQKTEYDMQMIDDVFDIFTKYHSNNRAYYRGWKSNDKHRTCAFRLKMTRVVLPLRGWDWGIDHDKLRELFDIDKVFAMLDGKQVTTEVEGNTVPMNGLHEQFSSNFQDIKQGDRISTEYFDFRFYNGVKTVHIFPRRKDLVDRLNRIVGKRRNWLPQESEKVDKRFWIQFDKAEKITGRMDKIFNKNKVKSWEINHGNADVVSIHKEACDDLGIDISNAITYEAHKEIGA